MPAVDAAVLTAHIYAPPEEQPPVQEGLGGRIRAARVRARLSQRELAAAINGSLTTVSCYESGSRSPSAKRLAKLESVLGPLEVES